MTTYPAPPVLTSGQGGWKAAKTPTIDWPIEDVKNLEINESTLKSILAKSKEAGSRFLRDITPQIKRANNRFKSEAILVLTMCPLENKSTGCLDDPSCRTERLIAALERPGGPAVIHFNLRTDCIRYKSSRGREDCLRMSVEEGRRCMEFLAKEITMARSFGIKFVSVFSFSAA